MLNHIVHRGIKSLLAAQKAVIALGETGRRRDKRNRFGEFALRGDWYAEETVINSLEGLPIRLLSEEHGETVLGQRPTMLGVLDGIDGSEWYRTGKPGYCTILAIFSKLNPCYDDYLFAGIIDHESRKLYFTNGRHTYLRQRSRNRRIHTSVDMQSPIHIDLFYDEVHKSDFNHRTFAKPLAGSNLDNSLPTGGAYCALLNGSRTAFLECTRKDNLELAAGYALVRDANGKFIDTTGATIGSRKFLHWGRREEIGYIAGIEHATVDRIVRRLREQTHSRRSRR